MNLGLEYLLRSGLIKDFFELPCSLFLEKEQHRKVAIMMIRNGKDVVQHWNLFQCELTHALPPMEEYEVEDFFHSSYIIPNGYRPIDYVDRPIPIQANAYNHPMDNAIYQGYFDAITHSFAHRIKKLDWLWTTFLKIYNLHILRRRSINRTVDIIYEQEIIRNELPKKWKIWGLWVEYLMPELEKTSDDAVPAELVFSTY